MPIRFIDEETEQKPKSSIRFVEEDTTTSEPQPTSQPEKKGYLGNLGEYWSKDIPQEIGGISQRFIERGQKIARPTKLGEAAQRATGTDISKTGFKGLIGGLVEGSASIPERVGRLGGLVAGTVGDIAGSPLSLGMNALNRWGAGVPGKVAEPIVESAVKSEPVKKGIEWWNSLPQADKDNLSASIDMIESLGWKVGEGVGKAVSGIGKKTTGLGESFLGGDLKIKDTLAKGGYGKTLTEKKKNILKNISKYNLESTTGNFQKMGYEASDLAMQKVKQADDILSKISQSPKAPKGYFVNDAINEVAGDINKVVAVGQEDQAVNILQKILSGATGRGVAGSSQGGIDELIKFKRSLDPDGKLFKFGIETVNEDPVERTLRKELYKNVVKKIRGISEEAANLNQEAKELIDISSVADAAASRTTNRNQFLSLPNMILGTGAAAKTYTTTQNPIATAVASAVPYATIKALGQGRGGSAVIRGGKGLRRLGESGLWKPLGLGISSAVSDRTRTNY